MARRHRIAWTALGLLVVSTTSCWLFGIAVGPFAGTWNSTYGTMVLTVDGTKVTGTYEYDDGRITGTISGKRLNFKWWQNNPGGTWETADPDDRGTGYFDISDDGNTLTGEWKYDGDADWWDGWNATRVI